MCRSATAIAARMLGVAYGPKIRSTLSWVISCSYSWPTLVASDWSSRTFHWTCGRAAPPPALSRSTNSWPAILWIAPVAANAPVSDSVEPTTIGAFEDPVGVVAPAVLLRAARRGAGDENDAPPVTDGMRVLHGVLPPISTRRCCVRPPPRTVSTERVCRSRSAPAAVEVVLVEHGDVAEPADLERAERARPRRRNQRLCRV